MSRCSDTATRSTRHGRLGYRRVEGSISSEPLTSPEAPFVTRVSQRPGQSAALERVQVCADNKEYSRVGEMRCVKGPMPRYEASQPLESISFLRARLGRYVSR